MYTRACHEGPVDKSATTLLDSGRYRQRRIALPADVDPAERPALVRALHQASPSLKPKQGRPGGDELGDAVEAAPAEPTADCGADRRARSTLPSVAGAG
jgi:hypothetical protein